MSVRTALEWTSRLTLDVCVRATVREVTSDPGAGLPGERHELDEESLEIVLELPEGECLELMSGRRIDAPRGCRLVLSGRWLQESEQAEENEVWNLGQESLEQAEAESARRDRGAA